MAYEQKPGDVIIFKNEKKGDNERAPDYKGNGKGLDGEDIEIALWLKQGAKGKFMAGRIKVKGEQQERRPEPGRRASDPGGFDDMKDDIPF